MFHECKTNDMALLLKLSKASHLDPPRAIVSNSFFQYCTLDGIAKSLQRIVTYEHTSPMELIKTLNSRRIQQQNEKKKFNGSILCLLIFSSLTVVFTLFK